MTIFRQFLSIAALLGLAIGAQSQDINVRSLYNMMPLSVNPAYTGDFEGTFRVGGMFKSYQSNVYQTPAFFVDVPILMVRKRDWVSGGVVFDSDTAGDLDMRTTRFLFSASYHLSLDKKAKSYLVAGYQFGSDAIGEFGNFMALDLENVNDNTVDNIDPMNNQNRSVNNFGLMYRSQVDKNTLLNIGASYSYIIRQNGSALSGGGSGGQFNRPSQIILHGLIDRTLNDQLSIHPSFIVRNRGVEGTDIMLQAMMGYQLKPELDLRLKGGIGYDVDQGPALLLGADYEDWKFGLSIEFPVYGIAETVGFGGFEISANRIIKVYKKPVVEPTICCPDL